MLNYLVYVDIGQYISEEIGKKLIPNLGSFLTQFLALVFLILMVFVFGYKRIKKMIKARQDYVENNINEAANKNKEATVNLNQANEALIASKKEAENIVLEAQKKAKVEQEKMVEQTKLEIIKMKEDAQEDIKRSQEEALESIRKEMVSVALDASSELLKRNVNSDDNEKLVDDFIRGIDA